MSTTLNPFRRISERREAAEVRAHRWEELGRYNSRLAQGIVHTPEYAERMAREQAAFDARPPR